MLYDARELENNSLIEGDICIVGAGAAGISIALDWINTPYKIILLEGGGFEYDQKLQELYRGEITGARNYPLSSSRLHYFGGTTNHWGGHCSPLDDIDFKKRDWIENSGWPILKKDLTPFFKKTSKILELHSHDFSLNYWQERNHSKNSLLTDNEVIADKIWQYSPPTRFNVKYKGVIEKAKNIHLYTYANTTDLLGNENVSNISEIIIKNHIGKTHRVKTKYFILACGAIQNARLLLTSNKQVAKGLGNENDVVGRYFMGHIYLRANELWMTKPMQMDHYIFNYKTQNATSRISITASKQEEYKILNGAFKLEKLISNRTDKRFFEMYSNEDARKNGYNNTIWEKIQQKIKIQQERRIDNIDSAFGSTISIEQAPNPNARVFLNIEKDALGMNRANLNWEITSLEKRSIKKIFELVGKELGFADIGRVKLNEALFDGNNKDWVKNTYPAMHHMGTTRMSNNPKKGVVDENCKVYNINNLFIAGSSCFATSGCANSTYTLVALSLRLSDFLKNKMN